MHLFQLDRFVQKSSRVHQLDPRTKLLGTVAFVFVAASLPNGAWLSLALLFGATIVVSATAGLGGMFSLKRSFVALPFALAAITLLFTSGGNRVAALGPLVITDHGLVRFASVVAKSWVSVQMAILLTATTSFPDMLWALQALRVPAPLISIVGFMYRYAFVIGDEATRLIRARAARAASSTTLTRHNLLWHGKVAGGMVGNLALRSFERSERIYAAMAARGFRGDVRMLRPPSISDADIVAGVGWTTFLATALLIGYVFRYAFAS